MGRGSIIEARIGPESAGTRLDRALADASARFPEGAAIPAPQRWGGLRVLPETVEFWAGGAARMHDRLRYRREDRWVVERLSP